MEEFTKFLEISTIHGLSHIASSKTWARVFWIFIVFGGFSGAGYLIQTSFYNWQQNPITTTLETLPISKITFPNITICPPRNTFLNLNDEIMKIENLTLTQDKRQELFDYALKVIQDDYFLDFERCIKT